MLEYPYLQWPVFRRSVVAAFERSLTAGRSLIATEFESHAPSHTNAR